VTSQLLDGRPTGAFSASNLVYRKEQMLAPAPAHMGANQVFAQSELESGGVKGT